LVCEAAHVPVLWATQVLEKMAKQGAPSRAEVTDAAMANRAECVMLNKGPHMIETVRALDDILQRMEARQNKKRSLLGPLGVAQIALLTASAATALCGERLPVPISGWQERQRGERGRE